MITAMTSGRRRRRKLFASLTTAVALVLFLICVVRKDDDQPRRALVSSEVEEFEDRFSFHHVVDDHVSMNKNSRKNTARFWDPNTDHDHNSEEHDGQDHEDELRDGHDHKEDESHDGHDHEDDSHDEHGHEDGSQDDHKLEDGSHDEHDHDDESHDEDDRVDGSHNGHDHQEESHDEHNHKNDSHDGHDHEDGSHDEHDHENELHDGHDHEEGLHDGHDHEEGSHDEHDHKEGSHDEHGHEEGSHDEHDHKEGSHDGHDHEEGSHDEHDQKNESHEGHDHGDDSHVGHDQGDASHDGHDHDSHDGHDHGISAAIRGSPMDSQNKNWAEAIGAALLVNLTTLIGVCFLVPATMFGRAMKFSKDSREVFLEIMIPSFACGALIATALFLMIPESLLYLALKEGNNSHEGHDHRYLEEHDDDDDDGGEADATWKFGASVLGGYFIPFLSSFIFPHNDIEDIGHENITTKKGGDTASNTDEDDHSNDIEAVPVFTMIENKPTYEKNYNEVEEEGSDDEPEIDVDTGLIEYKKKEAKPVVASNVNYDEYPVKPYVNVHLMEQSRIKAVTEVKYTNLILKTSAVDWNLASAILIGDFMHNFVDGIFIGVGFALCDVKFGWAIAFSTIWHELSQEVADFFLLVNQCGFSVFKALLFNFISGLSVIVGVLVILGTDLQQGPVIGSLLAIGSGVYFYLSLTEIAPRTKKFLSTRSRGVISFLMWICGAVPIGLVLLNHFHC